VEISETEKAENKRKEAVENEKKKHAESASTGEQEAQVGSGTSAVSSTVG
jgi:hypothetical protein